MAPVRGVVTLDGEPVEGAAVMFSPRDGGRPAIGQTDERGEFRLQTVAPGDGALLGEHAVTVTLQETLGITADPDGLSGEVAPGGIRTRWIVPERYSNPKTSNLAATVERGMPPVSLELTTK
jgi:hypothetical protein